MGKNRVQIECGQCDLSKIQYLKFFFCHFNHSRYTAYGRVSGENEGVINNIESTFKANSNLHSTSRPV